MNVEAVIDQIRAAAPVFAGNVAGAAQYARATADQAWLPRPAAYVIPLEDEPAAVANQTGYQQVIKERVGIIVDLDNSADRRGQAASTQAVDAIRAALLLAVANWRYDETRQARGFSYASGGLIQESLSRARLMWQFDFTIETWIDNADVWQDPAIPLTDINGTVTTTAGATLQFDAPLAQ